MALFIPKSGSATYVRAGSAHAAVRACALSLSLLTAAGALHAAKAVAPAAAKSASGGAGAEEKPLRIAPGLWEMTTRIKGGDFASREAMAASEARIAAMPPEQRRQLERTLASRGVNVQIGGDAYVAQICITREMADQGAIAPQSVGNCTTERSQRSGNTIRYAALCSKPRSTVEGSTTITSEKSIESKTTTTTELEGNTRMSTVEQSGRWLAADCGTLAAPAAGRR